VLNDGFVYALIEREFTKTGEPVIKVGMSRKSNPAERLRGYPRGSFYIWVRHTPNPVSDERLILATMRIWFKERRDIGAEYFEGDQNVVTGLLSALMQARESMQAHEAGADASSGDGEGEGEGGGEGEIKPETAETDATTKQKQPQRKQKQCIDSVSLFDAFAASLASELHCAAIPCEALHARFETYAREEHGIESVRVGFSWIEKQAKARFGATVRPRVNRATNTTCPMIVFPALLYSDPRSGGLGGGTGLPIGRVVPRAHPLFAHGKPGSSGTSGTPGNLFSSFSFN
jgi:hypothetical protein